MTYFDNSFFVVNYFDKLFDSIELATVEISIEMDRFHLDPKKNNFEGQSNALIVGSSVSGKSAFCNFLLNEKRFKERLLHNCLQRRKYVRSWLSRIL